MANTEECGKNMWQITTNKKIDIKEPILIVGLPGIGNVGKIAADLIVDELKATKYLDFFSHSLPNSVFVNEDNLIDLPKIEIYHKRVGKEDFLFLVGDVQPSDEQASYAFAEKILDIFASHKGKLIITLGGIGLAEIPRHPKVYCTGNKKEAVKEFQNAGVITSIYGVVGPIIGISGLLLGLSKKRGIRAASLLSETYGHPVYIGLPGARATLSVLMKKYNFKLSLTELDQEIKEFEKNIQPKDQPLVKKYMKYKDTNYIG